MRFLPRAAAIVLLAACNPTLNWRDVRLDDGALTAALPCKPDQAVRDMQAGAAPVSVHMAGCDAGGATYAVAYTALSDAAQVALVLERWRAAALARLGAQAPDASVSFAPLGALALPGSVRITASGHRPQGAATTLHAAWFAATVHGAVHVYQAVVLADAPRPEAADAFFSGLRLDLERHNAPQTPAP
ncbi:hypothetical protein PY257_11835 [Ramlibacter sp. H39-3-26]|uniref:hypothetical protein n=1 Tax=Curvibacter soli TaxID=3031331 RepID=UPI0023DCAA1C|nr:hypothetical protein [Ramlibacter sp. H39-3-26]MDF1485862.1 hypothetical protein [Ramlibacter sp. H39-3-26]